MTHITLAIIASCTHAAIQGPSIVIDGPRSFKSRLLFICQLWLHRTKNDYLMGKHVEGHTTFFLHVQSTGVTGYGKTAHFAHYFKIELLVFKGSVDLKQ